MNATTQPSQLLVSNQTNLRKTSDLGTSLTPIANLQALVQRTAGDGIVHQEISATGATLTSASQLFQSLAKQVSG